MAGLLAAHNNISLLKWDLTSSDYLAAESEVQWLMFHALGVIMDSNLTFQSHVSAVCKSSHFHLRALRHIRSSLTHDMAKTVAASFIQSRLDYANSILYGTSEKKLTQATAHPKHSR